MQEILSLGLEHHRQGRLDEAVRIYRRVLSEQPGNSDALHLLGVAALQQGDHRQAVELISRAVAGNPGNAAYHVNLAEAYRNLGQLDRAVDCCRTALRLQPHSAEATNN